MAEAYALLLFQIQWFIDITINHKIFSIFTRIASFALKKWVSYLDTSFLDILFKI